MLNFTFDGRPYTGFQGDTLASALLANGVHLVGRSFKYHRPRGIFSAGAEEPNALVGVRRDAARYTPNLRATQVELYEGLQAESQNRWPSLDFDVGAVNDLISPFIPAGFYYKTFMWPRSAWHSFYEPRIRAAAGLGRAPAAGRPGSLHQPLRSLRRAGRGRGSGRARGGAGRGSIRRARHSLRRAGRAGRQPAVGAAGRTARRIDGCRSRGLAAADAAQQLARNPEVTLLPRTTAFGYFPHNLVGLNERLTDHLASLPEHLPRERTWQVRAKEVVLATGAIERPLVFPGNDRPGIMLAGAARTYVNRYGVLPGTTAVVVAACDEAYRAALDLHTAGVDIALIVDIREQRRRCPAECCARSGPADTGCGSTIVGTTGRLRVECRSGRANRQSRRGVERRRTRSPATWC